VIYLRPFINTKDVGPVVLEIPPADDGAINGSVMNYWQAAIEDVGPAGVDKGEGGKYLILPPGHPDQAPDGYIAMPSDTYQGFALLRSVLQGGSDADVAQAVAYAKRIRLYPLSQAASPPPTAFVDASQVLFDAAIPYELRIFRALDGAIRALAGARPGGSGGRVSSFMGLLVMAWTQWQRLVPVSAAAGARPRARRGRPRPGRSWPARRSARGWR
jgi:hypothetical protein